MKARTLLVLTLLVVGMGAFIWFYERELPSSDERAELAKRVLTIEADAVERLEIDWQEGSVELARVSSSGESGPSDEKASSAGSEWRLLAPMEARADATAVSGLVRRIVELEKQRTLEEADREDAGLAAPRGTVRLATADGVHVLEIGAEVPASSNMMVGVEGRPEVFVVPAAIWTDLTKEPGTWRDKKLFVGERGQIDRVTLVRGDERLLLAKRGDQFWLEAPLVDRAEQSHVDSLLSALVGLRAKSFLDDPPADLTELGLAPPRAVVEVVLDGRATPLEYEIGAVESRAEGGADSTGDEAVEETLYLRAEGQLVTVSAPLDEHLSRSLSAWRSRELADMEVYEVDRARIADDEGEIDLERDGGEWSRNGAKIVYGPATDFLYEIVGARAERLVSEGEIELSEARLSVELIAGVEGDPSESSAETITLYAPVDGLTPARSSGRPAILLLSAEKADAIDQELADLRAAELESVAEEPAESEADSGPSDGAEG